MRHFWFAFVAVWCALSLAARVTGRNVYTVVRALGELAGALLLIGTFIAVVLHVLYGLGVPVPAVLPMVSLPID